MNKKGAKQVSPHYTFFPKNRRGQFYLAAAIVIVIVVIGIIVVANSSTTKFPSKLENIKDELQIEGSKMLEYKSLTGENKIEEFIKNYSDYIGEQVEIVFIVGEEENLDIYKYEGDTKTNVPYIKNLGNLIVPLEGTDYTFNLTSGYNFHFIIYQNLEEEKYVVTSN